MECPSSGLGMQNGCWIMITGTKTRLRKKANLKKSKDLKKSEKRADWRAEQRTHDSAGFSGQGFVI